jgi:hypothetical protein
MHYYEHPPLNPMPCIGQFNHHAHHHVTLRPFKGDPSLDLENKKDSFFHHAPYRMVSRADWKTL